MSKKSIPTIYALQAQNAQMRGRQHVVMTNTSLNQKFDIQANQSFDEADRLAIRYFVIGDGGHYNTLGNGNRPLNGYYSHTPDDAALFNHLPFVLRLPSNDLQPAERAKYRLRKMVTYGGQAYVGYYAKLLTDANSVIATKLRTEVDGVVTQADFIPTLANLSPTPQTPQHLLDLQNQYLVTTSEIGFSMSAQEVADFLEACNIIYGDQQFGLITELAAVQGVDRQVAGDLNGQAITYTEVIGAQIANFISHDERLTSTEDEFSLTVDISGIQPMYKPE